MESSTISSIPSTTSMTLFIKLPGCKNETEIPFPSHDEVIFDTDGAGRGQGQGQGQGENGGEGKSESENGDEGRCRDEDEGQGKGRNGGTKMSRIVLVPQLLQGAVRGVLTELLEGYG